MNLGLIVEDRRRDLAHFGIFPRRRRRRRDPFSHPFSVLSQESTKPDFKPPGDSDDGPNVSLISAPDVTNGSSDDVVDGQVVFDIS